MRINNAEWNALHDAIDFIQENAMSADEDKYPNDTLDGLRSIIKKEKKDSFRDLVRKELKKLKTNK
jgi:hypothetical protein